MSSLRQNVLKQGLPPLPAQTSQPPSANRFSVGRKKDYSVLPWTNYFEEVKDVKSGGNTFRVYLKGNTGTRIVFLHGGGFSGLSWAVLSKCLTNLIECQCIAPDLRGHGSSVTEDDSNLSSEQLANDVCDIIEEMNEDCSPVVLVGHSMGGAIAVHTAMQNRLRSLAALIMIDVVEGTAMASLHMMHQILRNRPQDFESDEKAIEWCVRSGYIRNLESARASMIGQLKQLKTVGETSHAPSNNEDDVQGSATLPTPGRLTWRTNLNASAQYWEGWFKGLSTNFLSVTAPKLLMLAAVDRLDRELTIGQMQGKFQMQVLPKSGHAVHEDCPQKVADAISSFLIRHKIVNSTTSSVQ
nr:protein phosphatase methylesterase 1-like [Ciona intestinalis]|eukprot:XP_009857686.1 protein phosphatase methylesterase 1-like [Ciona intestinalis]